MGFTGDKPISRQIHAGDLSGLNNRENNVLPTISIGPLTIPTYTLLRVTAVFVLLAGLALRLHRGRWPLTGRDILLLTPFLQVGLVLGAMLEVALPYLADHWFRGAPLPPGWFGGQRWLGALAGGSLVGYLFFRFRRLPVGRCFDLFAIPLPLVVAVGRVGCLLRGCCYGWETSRWPALTLPDVYGVWASRYPTRLASIGANLLIFILLAGGEWWANRTGRRPFDGFWFLLFVLLHCGQRFFFEFWRADTPHLIGPFTWQQLYAAIGLGLAVWGLVRGAHRPTSLAGESIEIRS